MKSFYTWVVLITFSLILFGGLLQVFNNIKNPEILSEDSKTLFTTMNTQYNEVDNKQLNVSSVQLGIQDKDAFSAEFYSASTDSKKKEGVLNTAKNIPNLVRFAIGQEDSFSFFWDNLMWFIATMVFIIGFVILFQRRLF